MGQVITLPDYVYESPSGEILVNENDEICMGPYCTCPFLSIRWTGEFNPGKLTACTPVSGDRHEQAGLGGYDYTFGYRTEWDLSGVIRHCDIRPSGPWTNWDAYQAKTVYWPYSFSEARRFICKVPLSGTITAFNTPQGTYTKDVEVNFAAAATSSGWIPINFDLMYAVRMENHYDDDEWEMIREIRVHNCHGYAPGGFLYGDVYGEEGVEGYGDMYGCGFNDNDFIHTYTKKGFYNEQSQRTEYFYLALVSTSRSKYELEYSPRISWGCDPGIYEYEDGDNNYLEGMCLNFDVSRRLSESSLYSMSVLKNIEIPTIFDDDGIPLPPSGCKEFQWTVNGSSFASVEWADSLLDSVYAEPGALGGTIDIPPSGFSKLEILPL